MFPFLQLHEATSGNIVFLSGVEKCESDLIVCAFWPFYPCVCAEPIRRLARDSASRRHGNRTPSASLSPRL